MSHYIYADNAATTPVAPEVLEAMLPFFTEKFGNASSIYEIGRNAGFTLLDARQRAAKCLGAARENEIYFTSGGSESDNWALKGVMDRAMKKGKNHLITTNFEHHAILHTCEFLEKHGVEVTYLPVNSEGYVTPEQVEAAITDKTALVSVMYANNEIGTIQPIAEIGKVCRAHKVLFHTDAVQAVGHVNIDVQAQNIDLLSMSAHKIHGPKGQGLLYCKNTVQIENLVHGGGQERGRRAGTENLAGIVGLVKALELASENIEARAAHTRKIRDRIIDELLKVPHSRLNGGRKPRLPGNINISFEGLEGESLLLQLDLHGIGASSGSACTSGSLDPSHVLLAIGLIHEVAHGSMRLSLSDDVTDEDADTIIATVPVVVDKLRAMSPTWEHVIAND